MFDNLPAALLTLFLAASVLWLIWRAFHRLLSSRKRGREPSLDAGPARTGFREASVHGTSATGSTIPDAADVLALKAAIDNLARQVAALEKRLAVGQTGLPPQPPPSGTVIEQRPAIPSVTPDHRI
jgi:hypothetical protein